MFKDIKLPFNLSILEGTSILGFIAIGFCIIYKTAYYNTIGVSWLINSLNPQLILISSIRFLFFFTIFLSLGWIIGQFLSSKKYGTEKFLLTIIVLALLTMPFELFSKYKVISSIFNLIDIDSSILFTSFVSFFLGNFLNLSFHNNNKVNKDLSNSNIKLYFNFFYSIVSISSITIFPYYMGSIEAQSIMNNKNKQNLVSLNDSKEKWFIIELIGDKVILMNLASNKTKIVELKEINYINNINFLTRINDN
ncbi:TPA: hypothetical protein JIR18_12365 [Acinetobacter baumannii]|nr:hypothetical protein [Acinetobacter baumannii]